jgi:uncharacterized protein (DUF779 family)
LECKFQTEDATLDDTLEKLCSLHNAGACHAEIIGLTDSGDYLLAKQPLCYPFEDFHQDRDVAAQAIKAVPAKGLSARGFWVYWEGLKPGASAIYIKATSCALLKNSRPLLMP